VGLYCFGAQADTAAQFLFLDRYFSYGTFTTFIPSDCASRLSCRFSDKGYGPLFNRLSGRRCCRRGVTDTALCSCSCSIVGFITLIAGFSPDLSVGEMVNVNRLGTAIPLVDVHPFPLFPQTRDASLFFGFAWAAVIFDLFQLLCRPGRVFPSIVSYLFSSIFNSPFCHAWLRGISAAKPESRRIVNLSIYGHASYHLPIPFPHFSFFLPLFRNIKAPAISLADTHPLCTRVWPKQRLPMVGGLFEGLTNGKCGKTPDFPTFWRLFLP